MKNRNTLLVCSLSLLLLCSCDKGTQLKVPAVLPESSGPFPVVAWHGVNASYSSPERFRQAREMGITLNYTRAGSLSNACKLLEDASSSGIKLIIECDDLYKSSSRKDAVTTLMKYPSLEGYFCKDEPLGSEFDGIAAMMNDIRKTDPDHLCYCNLFPTGPQSFLQQLGYRTYEAYVADYLAKVPVNFLSFDCYPIVDVGNGNLAVKGEWYENLEICAKRAERAGIPLWAFMLTVAHYSYPEPTIDHLRLQAYSDLAYGAQVLQCFTYWTPDVDTGDLPPYRNAPIAVDGTKTATYDIVQQMIAEINALAWIFNGAQRQYTAHLSGGGDIPQGTRGLSRMPDKLESINIADGGAALVSVLKNRGYTFMVVQNTSVNTSLECTVNMKAGAYCVHKDGKVVPVSEEPATRSLTPGDVRLYMWI